jgi:flagellar protein FlaJ
MYLERKYSIAVYAVSGGVALAIVLVLVVFGFYAPQGPYFIPLSQRVNNAIALAVLIAFGFPAVVEFNNFRWKRAVDRNIPRLLRDVTESVRSGLTLPRALEEASQRDYGPLSVFLKRALAQISWGVYYEEALLDMAKRIDTVLVRRAVLLIVETGRIGGNIMEIMDSIAKHIRSMEDLERERLSGIRPNIFITYMGFLVLLVSVLLIYTSFISELFTGEMAGSLGAITLGKGVFTQMEYLRIYLHTTAIVSFFGGLIAGQMGEGSIQGGLKHAVIMLAITQKQAR